jgi:hypothetical protein
MFVAPLVSGSPYLTAFLTRSDFRDWSEAKTFNRAEPQCTDPYARWCGREEP